MQVWRLLICFQRFHLFSSCQSARKKQGRCLARGLHRGPPRRGSRCSIAPTTRANSAGSMDARTNLHLACDVAPTGPPVAPGGSSRLSAIGIWAQLLLQVYSSSPSNNIQRHLAADCHYYRLRYIPCHSNSSVRTYAHLIW